MNDPHSYPQPKFRLPPKDQLIMGLHAIQEVLRHAPDRIIRLFTSIPPNAKSRKNELLTLCAEKQIPIETVSEDMLSKMTGSESHQSVAAHVKGRHFYDAKEFLELKRDADRVFVLMLDQIFDPQNFGSLLRTAECLGVDAVAWSKNRGCDLTPTVAKASCGASELIPLLRISNLADTVDQFKKEGYEIAASVADPSAVSLNEFKFAPRTVLIVGSEGEGIQPLLQKKADRLVTIPLKGKIESLNVAQAAAIFMAFSTFLEF